MKNICLETVSSKTASKGEVLGLAAVGKIKYECISGPRMSLRTYIVTRLAWMAARLVSSKSETRYAKVSK
jgi:hypothetical protein